MDYKVVLMDNSLLWLYQSRNISNEHEFVLNESVDRFLTASLGSLYFPAAEPVGQWEAHS